MTVAHHFGANLHLELLPRNGIGNPLGRRAEHVSVGIDLAPDRLDGGDGFPRCSQNPRRIPDEAHLVSRA